MTGAEFFTKPQITPEREEYYRRLGRSNAGPLWEVLAELVPKEPRTPCVAAHWRYEEMRPLIMEAGEIITEKEAERRVLILENPGIKGTSCITETLYAGLQLVLPNEEAPTHRHTASALRLVLESHGGYTAVEGERAVMSPGDFIVTPSWTYHDHGNPGNGPVIWMDVLDLPLVNHLEAGFAEHHPMEIQPVLRNEGDSLARFGANLLPIDYKPERPSTPSFHYPYSRSRETLHRMHKEGPIHICHGVKMRFVNPASGGPPMPMIGTFLQLLPAGFQGEPYRATDATIVSVIEGRGHSRIGETTVQWKEHDIFVIPSWHTVSHHVEGASDAILFSASDRPVQQTFHIWREQAPVVA